MRARLPIPDAIAADPEPVAAVLRPGGNLLVAIGMATDESAADELATSALALPQQLALLLF